MLISEHEVLLAEKARKIVVGLRRDIASGKKVAPWVTQLIADLDRHDDMSFVAVGWLLQDRGVLK